MGASELPENDAVMEPEGDGVHRPPGQLPDEGRELPLFLRDRSDGPQGNAQDEKDETGE